MAAISISATLPAIFHSTPPLLIPALFWAGSLLSLSGFVFDRRTRAIVKSQWKLIITLLLITLSWRIPPDGKFFHGLEYEDSYVYIVAARQMQLHVGPPSSEVPYSIGACAVGSLRDCQEWESYPEHFVGYPYVLSMLYGLVGYTPDLASTFNIFAASLGCVLIFLVAMAATENAVVAGASSLVFAITPVFAVYGLETSAEPASNVCIILVIWFYARFILAVRSSEGYRSSFLYWSAFSSVLLFSMTVKREDFLLGMVLPIMAFLLVPRKTPVAMRRRTLMLFMFTTVTLAVLLSVEMGLWQTTGSELELAEKFPLTAGRLEAFFLGFARSFFVAKWYMGAILAVAAGATISIRKRGLSLVPLVLFISYFMIYALHIRSYYEMQSANIEPYSALRFSMNFMCLWSLLAGVGIGAVIVQVRASRLYAAHRRASSIVGYCLMATLIVMSFVWTKLIRDDAVEDETNVRISPARRALHFAAAGSQPSDYVVTLEPLMVQMYGDTTVNVVDLSAVSSEQLRALINSSETSSFVAVEEADRESDVDFIRYGDQLRYLHSLQVSDLYRADGVAIVRIVRP
jgi:hypothetical protein